MNFEDFLMILGTRRTAEAAVVLEPNWYRRFQRLKDYKIIRFEDSEDTEDSEDSEDKVVLVTLKPNSN